MDDVYLEGATPDGPAVVGHLSVIVDTEGITFLGPEPGERRTVGWDRTSPLEFGPPAALPGGEQASSLEFAVDGRPLRLLVPSKRDHHDSGREPATPDPTTVAPVAVPESPNPVSLVAEMPAPLQSDGLEPEPLLWVAPPPPVEVQSEPPAEMMPEPPAALLLQEPVAPLPEPPAAVPFQEPVEVQSEPPVALLPEPPAAVPFQEPVEVQSEPPVALLPESPAQIRVPDDTPVAGDVASEEWDSDDPTPVRLPAWFRYAPRRPRETRRPVQTRTQRLVKLALFTILAGLIPILAGARYFQTHGPSGHIAGVALTDNAIAARVGIQPGDLPGWTASAPTTGNVFAAGATTQGSAALQTAQQSSTVMARCLHVPVSAVEGAFGMGGAIAQRSAQVTSPSYADPAGNGGAVNSVVDVVKTPEIQQADAGVFANPALFATCYQPFVQAMLRYAPGGGTVGFATATVQPVIVPVPTGPASVTVAGFQIARIANDGGQTSTVISTATAVFDGRVQATLGTVSDLVFSIDAQNELVRDLEIRTIGVGQL